MRNPYLNLCKNCPQRDFCTTLCEKAARYANQDASKKLVRFGRTILADDMNGFSSIEDQPKEYVTENHSHAGSAKIRSDNIKLGLDEWFVIRNELSLYERQVVYLLLWKQCTQAEVAHVLGLTQARISQIYMGTLPRLYKLLKKRLAETKND